jgi:hypothetical protein
VASIHPVEFRGQSWRRRRERLETVRSASRVHGKPAGSRRRRRCSRSLRPLAFPARAGPARATCGARIRFVLGQRWRRWEDAAYHFPPDVLSPLLEAIPLLCRSKLELVYSSAAPACQTASSASRRPRCAPTGDSVRKREIVRDVIRRLTEADSRICERCEIARRVVEFDDLSTCWIPVGQGRGPRRTHSWCPRDEELPHAHADRARDRELEKNRAEHER